MSENDTHLSSHIQPSHTDAPTGRAARKATIAFLLVFIILAGGVNLLRHQSSLSVPFVHAKQDVTVAVTPSADTPSGEDPRTVATEDKLQNLQRQIDALNEKTAQESAATGHPDNKQYATDIARLQSDLTSLSAAVDGLQAEIKRADSSAEQSQKMTQAALAMAIAFIQLRETALSGEPFALELSDMRSAAKNDGDFQEQLAKLEPFAVKGISTLAGLQNDLIAEESAATNAADRAMAKTMWDKIVAELKTLVSVRPVHGNDSSNNFAAMESALTHGDINTALDNLKTMPAAVQTELSAWRDKAEARQTIEAALRIMANHFAASANNAESVHPTKDAP